MVLGNRSTLQIKGMHLTDLLATFNNDNNKNPLQNNINWFWNVRSKEIADDLPPFLLLQYSEEA